jgi:dCTP deaminase
VIDPQEPNPDLTELVELPTDVSDPVFVLHPNEFALGQTMESVRLPHNIVARLEGKSSLGRIGLIIHSTAGFVDPGFEGNLTLEMTNLTRLPIKLRPKMLIGQISFQKTLSPVDRPYAGKYQSQDEPTASRGV